MGRLGQTAKGLLVVWEMEVDPQWAVQGYWVREQGPWEGELQVRKAWVLQVAMMAAGRLEEG